MSDNFGPRIARLCVLASAFLVTSALAGPGQLAIWCSPALKGVVADLVSQFERESGHSAVVKFGTFESLQGRLGAGEPPDVVIFQSDLIEGMQKGGKIDAATRIDVGRIGMGLAMRRGTPAPDISSADALRGVLVKAGSIAYPDPREGPGGVAAADAMAALGIAETLRSRIRLGGIGQGVQFVGHGEVEIALDHVTEIMARPAASFVGPLPGNLQRWVAYSAAIASDSINPDEAHPFLRFLAGGAVREKLRAAGIESSR